MRQVIIAIHIPTGNEHEFTTDQWIKRLSMTDEDGNKLYRFVRTENVRSTPSANTRSLPTSSVPKKKKGCGCGE